MIVTFENDTTNKNRLEKIKKETNWLKHLIYLCMGITALGMISTIIGIIFNMRESFYAYPFFLTLSIWIYWIGYVGINRSFSHTKIRKLNNSSTPQNKGFSTFDKINTHILSNKIYLNSDINRDTIAEEFEISIGYLSQLINLYTEGSFNDYINKLRVESSKKKLLDKQYDNYTIESIGLECGFKSKSNFYSTFKNSLVKLLINLRNKISSES